MMQNQKTKAVIIILFLAISIGSLGYLLTYKPPEKSNDYFQEQPETWIEDRYETEEQGDVEINVFKATRTRSTVDVGRQDYYVDGDLVSFFYTGFYKGASFSSLYAGDEAELIELTVGKTLSEQTKIAEERAIMRIAPKLNPSDGVIDSFVLAREENGKFVFYIFIDEDWRRNVEYTNILWGDNFKDRAKMHLKEFDFSNPENGIYTNKVEEDVDWDDLEPVKGGMMVGEVDYPVLNRLTSNQEFGETFIMVR